MRTSLLGNSRNVAGGLDNFEKALLPQWTLHTEEIMDSYDS